MKINSIDYWENRFGSLNWEEAKGKEQTHFFGTLALADNHLPAWFVQYVNKNALSICDFGCALGQITRLLTDRFPHSNVVGYDISHSGVERAKTLFPGLQFICEDLLLTNKKYDVLFSSNTLEHFYNPNEIINKLAARTNKFMFFLLPFYDDLTIEEHFYSFTYDNVCRTVNDQFDLIFYKEIDTSIIPNTHWFGKQIILIYAHRQIIPELENHAHNTPLLQTSKEGYRRALTDTLLDKEAQDKISEHLGDTFKIKLRLAEKNENDLSEALAKEQGQKKKLENELAEAQAANKKIEEQFCHRLACLQEKLEFKTKLSEYEKNELKQRVEMNERRYQELKLAHDYYKMELEQLQAYHLYVQRSVSWKLTKPIRAIKKALRLCAIRKYK